MMATGLFLRTPRSAWDVEDDAPSGPWVPGIGGAPAAPSRPEPRPAQRIDPTTSSAAGAALRDPTRWRESDEEWERIGALSVDRRLLQPAGRRAGASWEPRTYRVPATARPAVLFFYCDRLAREGSPCDCTTMRGTVFPDEALAPHRGGFDWYRVDMDGPQGVRWGERFRVSRTPTVVVVAPSGEEVWRGNGLKRAEWIAEHLAEALDDLPEARARADRLHAGLGETLDRACAALAAGDGEGCARNLEGLLGEARALGFGAWVQEAEAGLAFAGAAPPAAGRARRERQGPGRAEVDSEGGAAEACRALIPRLTDRDPAVRCEATEALAGIAGSSEARMLVRMLEDPDYDVAQAAAAGICRLAGDSWLPGITPTPAAAREWWAANSGRFPPGR